MTIEAFLAFILFIAICKGLNDLAKFYVIWSMRQRAKRGEVDPDLAEAFVSAYRHDYKGVERHVADFKHRILAKQAVRR